MQRILTDRSGSRSAATPGRVAPAHRGRTSNLRWKGVLGVILLFCFTALFFTSLKLRRRTIAPSLPQTQPVPRNQGSRKLLPPDVPRVALLFFGLTRSLKFTLPSIEGNILAPLQEMGVQVDVFLHTYNDTDDASSVQTNKDEWQMLKPTAHVITSQQLFLNTTENLLSACWERGTGWVKAPPVVQQRNMQNLMCQLNSVKEVGSLWLRHAAAHRLQYSAVVYLRPDVLYTDPLPVQTVSNITDGTVAIPDWAHYTGMNDRFALLGPRSAAQWKERLAYTLQHCLDKPLHAEMFAQDFAVDHDFDVLLLQDFVFYRVRSDGSIPRGDDPLPGLERARQMLRQRREELRVAHQVQASHP